MRPDGRMLEYKVLTRNTLDLILIMQSEPGHIVLYQPPRPLHPLLASPLLPVVPLLPDPAVHTLLVPPVPRAVLRRLSHALGPAAQRPGGARVQGRPAVAGTINQPARVPLARARDPDGVPEFVARRQHSEAEEGGCRYLVLASHPGGRTGGQGGRGGSGKGVGGGAGIS